VQDFADIVHGILNWTLAKDNLAKTVDQAKTSRLAAIEG
jgi:hypothetical protein